MRMTILSCCIYVGAVVPKDFDVEVMGLRFLVDVLDDASWCTVKAELRSKKCPVIVEVQG